MAPEPPPSDPQKRPSVVFDAPDLSVDGEHVSDAEIRFFVDNGFLVKKRLLDSDALAAALERIWAYLLEELPPAEGTAPPVPDDPTTWISPRWAPMPAVRKSGPYQGRQRIFHSGRTVKLHDIGDADYLLDLVPNNPRVRQVVRVLLGDDLKPSTRTRGIYAVFPQAGADGSCGDDDLRRALGPHTDQVCQQLNACVYLDDVPPRNGGFTLYPGSHRIMFRAHRLESNWSPLASFRTALHRVVAEIEPCELVGAAGDVIFWHGRMVHSTGIHVGNRIRWALFADFAHDRATLDLREHKRLGQFEWFKDVKLFAEDLPVGDDMWRGWKLGA